MSGISDPNRFLLQRSRIEDDLVEAPWALHLSATSFAPPYKQDAYALRAAISRNAAATSK